MAPRIVVALTDERQEYQRLQAEAARDAAERAGVEIEVLYAENNALVQIHQLFQKIHSPESERPTAIIAHSVSGGGLERVGRNAISAGIAWIAVNRRVGYVEGLRKLRPDLAIGLVSPDQVEAGRIHGRQARRIVPGGGPLLYVQGPPDISSSQDRLQGSEAVLTDAAFQLKVVNGDWTESSAVTAVGSLLRLRRGEAQKPALVIAQNDAMATGARRAVIAHDASWRDIPVIGCDGLPAHGQKLVASGDLAATVIMPPSTGEAVDLVARWLREGTMPPVEVVLAPRSFPPEERLGPR